MLKEQRSFQKGNETGTLYVVPTPIGNLQDMTFRAVDILKEADIIAAEDTRHSKKLCHVFDIGTPLISYHEHNKKEREGELVARAQRGEVIALVSDAGMPAISDPGVDLVKRFIEEGLTVVGLPGANAAVTSLVVSGLPTDAFTFIGFLDRNKKHRKQVLEQWKGSPSTLIFYEAPHRLKEMLKAVEEVLGNRNIALCRELTKQYETILRGTVEELKDRLLEEAVKGECVVVIEGATEEEQKALEDVPWWVEVSLIDHIQKLMDEGETSKQAIKSVAVERGIPKREVYQAFHVEEEN